MHSQWLYRSNHWCTVSGYIGVTTGAQSVVTYIGVTTGAQSVVI